jgi:hypothetical protein
MILNLTNKNFLQYAANNYDNNQCSTIEEFNEDVKRFQYIKRLFNRYGNNTEEDSKICRLILNHIIIILNVFGVKSGLRMLFLKLEGYYSLLVPFLIFMDILPNTIENINGKNIIISEIFLNPNVINRLNNLNAKS